MSSAHITINVRHGTAAGHAEAGHRLRGRCGAEHPQTAQAETEDVVRKMAAEVPRSRHRQAPIQARAKEGAKMEKDGAWSSGLWDQIQKL
jgi:hypothetical protein